MLYQGMLLHHGTMWDIHLFQKEHLVQLDLQVQELVEGLSDHLMQKIHNQQRMKKPTRKILLIQRLLRVCGKRWNTTLIKLGMTQKKETLRLMVILFILATWLLLRRKKQRWQKDWFVKMEHQ